MKPKRAAFTPVLHSNDKEFRSSLAKITRNGVDIRIPPGHPLYLKARDEEGLEDFELVKLVAELGADDEEASVEVQQKLLEEAQLIKQQQRTQEQVVEPRKSRSTRVKTRAGRPSATLEKPTSEEVKQNVGVKRKISYEDVKDKPVLELTEEERMAIKEEPMEFDMSSLPSFTQFFMSQREVNEERTRSHERSMRSRKLKFSYEKKKLPTQEKPSRKEVETSVVPKGAKRPRTDYAYAIHLTSQPKIDLFVKEIVSVRGIASTTRLPERLEFHYQNGYTRTWPLQRILDQDYHVLKSIYRNMSSATGFTEVAKREILRKMEAITKEWNSEADLPKRLDLPYTGSSVHENPDWLMVFRDNLGVRRFFRMRDHAKLADIDTLRFMQSKLNSSNHEENIFIRQLQKFIEEREDRERKERKKR